MNDFWDTAGESWLLNKVYIKYKKSSERLEKAKTEEQKKDEPFFKILCTAIQGVLIVISVIIFNPSDWGILLCCVACAPVAVMLTYPALRLIKKKKERQQE